ncbi:hypothetical protein HZC07_04920 [Candidatus Micrarchaeota archaeon]|nr:hypothetical protein [Candidatus Micrarchaeota archaeon]
MHESHPQSDVMETVKKIKAAEDEYEKLVSAAKQNAESIIKKAKDSALEERAKTHESAVKLKNDRLQQGVKQIDSAISHVLDKTKSDADKLRKKTLDSEKIQMIAKNFLASL